ncbi:chromosomal replication initiator protein DnaA [Xylocopilactobacillus apicola]|uniref:Chromosomal replication initiator protein DnaA n=1 Tax=Xylocopilactobacillus apicola TaxID=2932184 RepID=A0AAU9D5L6_9LACO|nr:chromosomal replication initiator protein DnaA [Xylocopilactobacillus apicola]BDR57560.1 chromosomal replication initiator protein DnaA [Xylocopilactobacillus apicola]
MSEITDFWSAVNNEFNNTMTKASFDTWIQTTHPVEYKGNQIYLEVPSPLHKGYWENNLVSEVTDIASGLLNKPIHIIVRTTDEYASLDPTIVEEEVKAPVKDKPQQETHLNGKYTFDSFVTGKGNEMAHAAALVVAENPGATYNPLLIYGGGGLGKTHLMEAIGHYVLDNENDKIVKYVTSETFTNDFINSIRSNHQEEFRQAYRNVDVLLVDDIQFLADKEGTQEEFFHTFNTLYNDQKQIVLTSDRLPNEIAKLSDRLVSRFKWGLSVDVAPPDLETRIAILQSKAHAESLEISDETITYIAKQVSSNVRELEGTLVRVQAYSAIKRQDITTELAMQALDGLKVNQRTDITASKIQRKVADFYEITPADLKGKKRSKTIVVPRQIAMYLCRELTSDSLPRIGQEFGGKDHTTVMHAINRIQEEMEGSQRLRDEVNQLKNKIRE